MRRIGYSVFSSVHRIAPKLSTSTSLSVMHGRQFDASANEFMEEML
jgi:hypothetical protein